MKSYYSITLNTKDIKEAVDKHGLYEACERIAGDTFQLPFIIKTVSKLILSGKETVLNLDNIVKEDYGTSK